MTATEIALEQYLDETRDQRLERYLDFLRIPSISTLPDHANDCRTAADWLAEQLATIGVENVKVEETGGHPSSPATGSMRRPVPRPRSSTATTTCNPSIHRTSGESPPFARWSRATAFRPAAQPTTRARS